MNTVTAQLLRDNDFDPIKCGLPTSVTVLQGIYSPLFKKKVTEADVILLTDCRMPDMKVIVYGKTVVARMTEEDIPQDMCVLEIPLHFDHQVDDLTYILATVQAIKGRHEYQGKEVAPMN